MSKTIWQKPAAIGALAMGLTLLAGSAHATYSHNCGGGGSSNPDCYTWTFDSQQDVYNGVKGTPISNPAVTASVKGWSNTGTGGLLETAYIGSYSGGMGVTNEAESGTSPNHAVDNYGKIDSIQFSFSEAVNLDSFYTAYVSGDSDFTVLAYLGAGTPTLAGKTYSQLLSDGWSKIGDGSATHGGAGHYGSDLNKGNKSFENNVWSSFWLIGALNTTIGGINDGTYDYFKLLSVAGCDCSTAPPGTPGCGGGCIPGTPGCGGGVPEPGTLLLMAIGLLGLTYYNKQRPQAQV
ncbi:MAG: PEP-CTERM sorting domain-containing protein [Hydrogenophilaceae bacterium]|nr:PEP-CTERM sorting domain-containing protein [Hydrogenophilaceae bacterium]